VSQPAQGPRAPLGANERTTVHRRRERARHERAELYAILDDALIAHVSFVSGTSPVVLPMVHARDGDTLLLHGSSATRMLRELASGAELCAAVTLVDGLVLANAAVNHSMNYRSAVVYGRATEVTDPTAKTRALGLLIESLHPGRGAQLPPPGPAELRATLMLAVSLQEASVKVRTGPPNAGTKIEGLWTGVIPLSLQRGEPLAG
jgi:nitroimidazol reductase NimA-like FMN-containing flavoprotein (pyridoxamine 5'-phosphate oxidase superfamily)